MSCPRPHNYAEFKLVGVLGMSLEDVASKSFLDAALLSAIERGQQLVSTAKLDRLASTLGLDAFALYRGREVEQGLLVLPRHAARPDFRHDDLSVLRHALDRATALLEVSALLGKKSLTRQFKPEVPGAEPARDGYHCARLVRKALNLFAEPLDDLHALLAETFDIPVVVAPLATGTLQAAAVRSSISQAVAIVLNSSFKDGPVRGTDQARLVDRVSICHELCHVLFDEPKGGTVDVMLDDAPRDGQEKPPIEQRAGAFAAEMLIPLHGLKRLLGEEGSQVDTLLRADQMVDEVRERFRTPAEIAVNHLYNHGYVAKVAAFREALIEGAKERAPSTSISNMPNTEAWRQVLLARTQQANDSSLITDGAAQALLELSAGEPLPWERDTP